MLEQSVPEGLHPWKGPTLEQFVKNCSHGKDPRWSSSWRTVSCGRDPTLEQGKRVRRTDGRDNGWQLNHFPGQPVPMLDNPLSEVKFPNIQSKPPLAQLEAISSHPVTCYLGEETDPHLSTASFQAVVESNKVSPQPPFLQAEQPQFPQPLLISLVLQTLPQLRCPSLDTLQPLNVSLVVGGPKLNTVFEVRPHQCPVQGHDHFPGPAGHTISDASQDAVGFLGHLGTLVLHTYAQCTRKRVHFPGEREASLDLGGLRTRQRKATRREMPHRAIAKLSSRRRGTCGSASEIPSREQNGPTRKASKLIAFVFDLYNLDILKFQPRSRVEEIDEFSYSSAVSKYLKCSVEVLDHFPELVHKEVYSTWTHAMGPNTCKEVYGIKEDVLEGCYEVSPQPSLLQAEQPQPSQHVLVGEVLQPAGHFHGPPLDLLQQVHVFPVLRAPELDAVLQVGSHQSRVEGQNPLPRPAGHAAVDAAQDTVGLLGCERALWAHVQLFIHQHPQVLFRRAALDHTIPQPVLKPRIAPTQVQDPALGLVEPHEVHTGPLLQLVQVPQLGVICKLAEGALILAVNVIDENIEQHWSHSAITPVKQRRFVERWFRLPCAIPEPGDSETMDESGRFSRLTNRMALSEVLDQPPMQVGRRSVVLQSVGEPPQKALGLLCAQRAALLCRCGVSFLPTALALLCTCNCVTSTRVTPFLPAVPFTQQPEDRYERG
ncbi:hypothetical protein QYF61_011799 [Mycteria americana]|uniref:Uncharacterized protein n=1 Tax=Mycteria americana TaxID=33587 RepID=A0AAN7N7S3_MYCAM|nr:hypothetical protein QYF61_011799 [Mycteria americana]